MEDEEVDENNSQVVVIDKYSSHSVSIPNKFAQQHLPPLASGKSMILEFEDFGGNKFMMEVVHSNYGDYYYLRTGWDRFQNQHKLESGDFIYFSKKNDSYLIYSCKTPKPEELDLQLPNESIERVQVLVKNLCAKDPKCLRLSKKEVEGNLDQNLILQVGEEIILPLHDPIQKKSFTVQLLHADQEEYHIRGREWEEYVAQHNLFIFDETTIFVNKVILDPTAEVQLVNISYHYEITYQTRATNQPQKKPKLLGTTAETSSAPASTAVDNSSAPASTTVDNKNS
uniref:TF-B3 domain-containing protein n=1 Tax=Solanum tuberosum TaxID=4113 RepID=M1DES8_SOLTU